MTEKEIVQMFYEGYSIKKLVKIVLHEDKVRKNLKSEMLTRHEALFIIESAIIESLKKEHKQS